MVAVGSCCCCWNRRPPRGGGGGGGGRGEEGRCLKRTPKHGDPNVDPMRGTTGGSPPEETRAALGQAQKPLSCSLRRRPASAAAAKPAAAAPLPTDSRSGTGGSPELCVPPLRLAPTRDRRRRRCNSTVHLPFTVPLLTCQWRGPRAVCVSGPHCHDAAGEDDRTQGTAQREGVCPVVPCTHAEGRGGKGPRPGGSVHFRR